MKRRLLLPTDFSRNAQNAIDYAINLFRDEVCEFYILNTYSIEAYTMELALARDLEESKKKSIAGLSNILERLSVTDESINHKFHMVSECGSLVDIMTDIVDKRDIDIVIMGTKGATDSSIDIYGSQTVLAMEKIRNCPVMAIPSKARFKEIKDIVFPTSYSLHYKKHDFQILVDIAKITKAAISVLNVLDKDEGLDEDQLNNQNRLKDYFEGLQYSFHTLNNKNVQIAVNSFVESRNSDMVVFINKKHNFFRNLLSKTMAKNLGYHSVVPVLALHDLRN
ncbi:MAG: universal stress protein [Algibacter sp.]|uniref:universal stress protein n=1 Tax=Algibacter sp. TaxID=1872428 RepID=UPI00260E4A81|nr:universal stress protein [Algibacter sp.]MDG1729493.1 universal stress protein [Algibacter sp.]MDG2178679.1 universal stress protein [Algibacter sp.]